MKVEKGQILIRTEVEEEAKLVEKMALGFVVFGVVVIGIAMKSVQYIIGLLPIVGYLFFLGFLEERTRLVIMDKNGCYVKKGWRKRFYRWEEIRVKRLEQYWRATGGTNPDDYLVLSVHRLYKPKWMYIENYTCFICPFAISVFWVDLRLDYIETEEKSGRIDRDEFLDTLKEWGVELEDRRLKKWYRYR